MNRNKRRGPGLEIVEEGIREARDRKVVERIKKGELASLIAEEMELTTSRVYQIVAEYAKTTKEDRWIFFDGVVILKKRGTPSKIKSKDKYGRLTVLHQGKDSKDGTKQWVCECLCGNTVLVCSSQL